MLSDAEFKRKAAAVRMIVLDVDGVLTDRRVYLHTDGSESKAFDIGDGFGVYMARNAGLKFAIITGVQSLIVENRAAYLRIREIHQGHLEKGTVMKRIMAKHNLKKRETAFMGDDLFDIPAMTAAGLAVAPADAHPEVLKQADWVSQRPGGRGAVREFIEAVLQAKGMWEDILRKYAGLSRGGKRR